MKETKKTKETFITEEPAVTEVTVTEEIAPKETAEKTAATTEETTITFVGGDDEWLWSGTHRGESFGSEDPVTSLAIALEKAKAETRTIDAKYFAEFYAARDAGDSAGETTGL